MRIWGIGACNINYGERGRVENEYMQFPGTQYANGVDVQCHVLEGDASNQLDRFLFVCFCVPLKQLFQNGHSTRHQSILFNDKH